MSYKNVMVCHWLFQTLVPLSVASTGLRPTLLHQPCPKTRNYIYVGAGPFIMKSEAKDLREGQWRLMPESEDDLWLLSQVILPGDLCTAATFRKIQKSETASIRKRVVITVEVERVEFEGAVLRLLGVVREGPEDVPRGDHHSLAIETGTSVTIVKPDWPFDQRQRIDEACERQPPAVLLVVFDREEACLALLRRQGYELLTKLTGDVERKRMQQAANADFFTQLYKTIQEYDARLKPAAIVLGSPAFWKDEFFKRVDNPAMRKRFVLATTSGADEAALGELLRRDELKTALAGVTAANDARLMDEVLAAIGKGGAVCYGTNDCENAANAGAIATLLVADTRIAKDRQAGVFARIDAIMRATAAGQGKVVIVNGKSDAGKKLDGIGGIAALLRYRLS
jgi:protein pelota